MTRGEQSLSTQIAETLLPRLRPGNDVVRLAPEDFAAMRKAGLLAAETLDHIAPFVRPGVSTNAIDAECHAFLTARGGLPAPLFYRGFPKSVCTSVNHVICHGIPSEKLLHDGDIVNIDVTVVVDGWHGDSSRMYYAGTVPRKATRLCDITYEAMMRGIAVVRPGATTGDIGHAIQSFVEAERCSVVMDFCGHGIGRVFQGPPEIVHYGEPDTGVELVEGMAFTIEPMINLGKPDARMMADGWTAVTRDKSLSAQFEHTLAITAAGYEVFTTSPAGLHHPPYGV